MAVLRPTRPLAETGPRKGLACAPPGGGGLGLAPQPAPGAPGHGDGALLRRHPWSAGTGCTARPRETCRRNASGASSPGPRLWRKGHRTAAGPPWQRSARGDAGSAAARPWSRRGCDIAPATPRGLGGRPAALRAPWCVMRWASARSPPRARSASGRWTRRPCSTSPSQHQLGVPPRQGQLGRDAAREWLRHGRRHLHAAL